MESQIYYRPSSQETAEYLERCLGRISEYAQSHTEREGTKISQGHSEQGVALLTAQEIRQMGDEDIIGFHRRLQPFQAKRMDGDAFRSLPKDTAYPLLRFQCSLSLNHLNSRRCRQPILILMMIYPISMPLSSG
jgi:hypothetical protein